MTQQEIGVKKRYLLSLIACLVGLSAYLFIAFYNEAEKTAIRQLNDRQQIHATQAARGIEDFFTTWTGILNSFSKMDSMISADADGKRNMTLFYETHHEQIRSITRVDEKGRILHTVPYSRSIDSDISGQKHMREILRDHEPVVSDAFTTVQGFEAVALHVPVFKRAAFKGTIAIVIDFESLAKRYLEAIKIGRTGYAWVVSREGTILYSPVPGITGRPALDTFKDSPTLISLTKEMLQGRQGTAIYTYDRIAGQTVAPVKKYAVYMPVHIANSFWSVVVASSEDEVLSSLASFRNKLILVIVILLLGGVLFSIISAKAWLIVAEEKKRKKAQEELLISEAELRKAQKVANVGNWTWHIKTGRLEWSDQMYRIFGFDRNGFSGDLAGVMARAIHPDDRAKVERSNLSVMRDKKPIPLEYRVVWPDGTVRVVWAEAGELVLDGHGEPEVITGIVQDITERKRTAMLLQEANERVTQILGSVAEGIYGIDSAGNCTFCNPAAVRILGYRGEHELIGRNMHDLVHHTRADGTPYPREECIVRNAVRTRKQFHSDRELLWRADGTSFPAEYWAHPIVKDDIEQGTVVSFVDRTEHLTLENQLRQAQKMEDIGTLAGGIAHDFNNILSAILGYGHVALMKMPKDDPQRLYIGHILESADRAAALTQSLLAFSRKQIIDRKPVDLNNILRKVEKFLVRVIGEDVAIHMALAEGALTAFADAGQMEQVFMNLATNARDAMPNGGSFSIETSAMAMDSGFVAAHGYGKPGTYALISVTDTGLGMTEETRSKIFEPFFTTKEVGRGTGLGLAMVYGIIKQHEGFINVYSEPGQGSTFRIYLPLTAAAEMEEREIIDEDYPKGGSETILLAEDDANLRTLSVLVLEKVGYTVITANNGEEAVAKFTENKDNIQLLLFDIIMPKKNGREAYDEIRKARPDIPVLFASGYSPDIIREKSLIDKDVALIYKPMSPQDLLKKVREVLDAR